MRAILANNRHSYRSTLSLCVGAVLVCAGGARGAGAASLWAVDGGGQTPIVFSSVVVPTSSGPKLWLGGNFSVVGKVTGRAAWFNTAGSVVGKFAKIAATSISAVAPTGKGEWLLGGQGATLNAQFAYTGTLIHVLSSGAIDPNFKVSVEDSGSTLEPSTVRAIATLPGGQIVIGGAFTKVNGVKRPGVAMLDATGKLLAWTPKLTSTDFPPVVLSLAVDGNTIYIGGAYDHVGGTATGGLAGVDSSTGQLVWSLPSSQIAVGWSLVAQGSTLYAGVSDNTSNGSAVESIDIASGKVNWSTAALGYPYALAFGGGALYAGGYFTGPGGVRTPLVALHPGTGALITSFNPAPDVDATVDALAYAGKQLYAGGGFSTIGGQARHNLAALNPATGAATSWNPSPGNNVASVAATPQLTVAGGYFGTANAVTRSLFAEVDPVTGEPSAFAPAFNGTPIAMVTDGTDVYMAGGFDRIGGATRNYAAAFDIASHTLTSFAPNAVTDTFSLESIAVSGALVYIGGDYSMIGSTQFANLAAFDKSSGAIDTGFHPQPNAPAQGLLAGANGTLYVSGPFSSIAGAKRNGAAAFDTEGKILAFNPDLGGLDGYPMARLASDPVSNDIVLFGNFTSVSGQAGNIAEVDPVTGKPAGFVASAPGPIDTVSVDPVTGTLYAGGQLLAGGVTTGNLAAFDQAGHAVPLAHKTDGEVHTSQIVSGTSGQTLDIGGAFSTLDKRPQQGFSAIALKAKTE